jgi:hypothetical protein
MNFRRLSSADLADFAANVASLLAGPELTAIDPPLRAELLAALGTLPAELEDKTLAAVIAEDERRAAVSDRNATRVEIRSVLARVRDSLGAGVAPRAQYVLCGFDGGAPRARIYVAADPSDLSAAGTSNGVNSLRFAGNNRIGQVVYEIWRREADGPWAIHATTRRQSFEDTPVTPGMHYQYKVRAVAARSMSNFSNTAVVYGRGEGASAAVGVA